MVAVGSLLVIADLAWLLRIPPAPSVAAGLVTLLVWFLGPLLAAIAGGYPRLAETRRQRSVAEAQRAQRLRLTRDLHDFVAHDVTGIVVQAQAAQHVGQHDPAIALEALRRIEIAGQQALASIDHALDLLRDDDPLVERSLADPTQEVADMVAGFGVAGGPTIEADIDDTAWRAMGPDRVNLARRVLAEALTNVRRHAPATSQVQVRLTADDHQVELTVTNPLPDGPPSARSLQRGGQGLDQLGTLVADSGGELTAGSCGDHWLLRLRLPALRTAER
jgi:signal transduction histidine kinase